MPKKSLFSQSALQSADCAPAPAPSSSPRLRISAPPAQAPGSSPRLQPPAPAPGSSPRLQPPASALKVAQHRPGLPAPRMQFHTRLLRRPPVLQFTQFALGVHLYGIKRTALSLNKAPLRLIIACGNSRGIRLCHVHQTSTM